jgi:hypothetical protein
MTDGASDQSEIERTVSEFLDALAQGDHLRVSQLLIEEPAFFRRLENEASTTDGLRVLSSELSVERLKLVWADGRRAKVEVVAGGKRVVRSPDGNQASFEDSLTGPVSLLRTSAGWRVADHYVNGRPSCHERYLANGDPVVVEDLALNAVALKRTPHAYWLYLRVSNTGTEANGLRGLVARQLLWRDKVAWVPSVEFDPGQSGVIAAYFDPKLRVGRRMGLEAYVGPDAESTSFGWLDVRLTRLRCPFEAASREKVVTK